MRNVILTATIAHLAACESGVSGVVLDASTEAPVANAIVGLASRSFGRESDQILWDKDFVETVRTTSDGGFSFETATGSELSVQTLDGTTERANVCSKSPMTVRVGGPYAHLAHRQLLLGSVEGNAAGGWKFAVGSTPASDADLSLAAFPNQGDTKVRLIAPFGMAFRAGTGNPPQPPVAGYLSVLDVETMDCGWLLVRLVDRERWPFKPDSSQQEILPGPAPNSR